MQEQAQRQEERRAMTTKGWKPFNELQAECDRCLAMHCTSCPIARELLRYER